MREATQEGDDKGVKWSRRWYNLEIVTWLDAIAPMTALASMVSAPSAGQQHICRSSCCHVPYLSCVNIWHAPYLHICRVV